MKKLLWLDDLRNPFLDKLDIIPKGYTIFWVRYFDEFTEWIIMNELPDIIYFDHDLGEGEKTGNDCAKWLVDYCIQNDIKICEARVHSHNPVGADNIRNTLNDYLKYYLKKYV